MSFWHLSLCCSYECRGLLVNTDITNESLSLIDDASARLRQGSMAEGMEIQSASVEVRLIGEKVTLMLNTEKQELEIIKKYGFCTSLTQLSGCDLLWILLSKVCLFAFSDHSVPWMFFLFHYMNLCLLQN